MMRHLITFCSLAFILLSTAMPTEAQETPNLQAIPNLNVEPLCRGIASHRYAYGERNGPDLGYRQCIQSEIATRRRLARLWPSFSASSKSDCLEDTSGALPSYTDLLTCLQMARDVGRMRHRPQ